MPFDFVPRIARCEILERMARLPQHSRTIPPINGKLVTKSLPRLLAICITECSVTPTPDITGKALPPMINRKSTSGSQRSLSAAKSIQRLCG